MRIQYFDSLALLPAPPVLPSEVRSLERELFSRRTGRSRADFERAVERRPAARYLFRVACSLWARREARTRDELLDTLCAVNEQNLTTPFDFWDVAEVAEFVALNYARGPRRKTKRGARRYHVSAFDAPPVVGSEWVM